MTTTAPRPNVLEKPVVLFDGSCTLCVTTTDQLRALDKDGALDWRDLNDEAMRRKFPRLDWARVNEVIHLIHRDGRVVTGSRAVRDIAEMIGGEVGKSVAGIMNQPGVKDAADIIYGLVSSNRGRISSAMRSAGIGGKKA